MLEEIPSYVMAYVPEGQFEKNIAETMVELMSISESFRYARAADLQAVELPYAGGELAMLVLVPDQGMFESTASSIDASAVGAIVDALEPVQVGLRIPKYEFTTRASLVPALGALGMDLAFDADRADFSAMTTEAALFISDVVHEAFISVDEAGTEAAAATAVVMDLTAAHAEPIDLIVNRPFLFVIRHVETNAILFIGHIVDP